jgi:hypothetical protein
MSEREALVIHTKATRTGDHVQLTLTVDLPAGVHIEPHHPTDPYLIPTVLEVEDLADAAVGYPAPTTKDLGWNDLTLTVLEGTLTFTVSGRAQEGTERINGTLSFQPCVGGACLPPRTVRWVSPLIGQSAYSVLGALASRHPVALA